MARKELEEKIGKKVVTVKKALRDEIVKVESEEMENKKKKENSL